jgi:hypothetical protein
MNQRLPTLYNTRKIISALLDKNNILNREQQNFFSLDGTPSTSIVLVFGYTDLNRGQNNMWKG